MAGHSHSANIAHRKGRVDKMRGKLFGKLSRAIIVAAQHGGGDPSANMTLRIAVEKARKLSMPKDNIERAIKRGVGDVTGEGYQELVYEGYGVAGVAVIVDALTENRNRTAGEIRKTFEVHGGNLGSTGCVAWMFDRKGLFTIPKESTTEEALMEFALEVGADDVQESDEVFELTCPPDLFAQVSTALETAGLETRLSELTRIPANTIDLAIDDARKVLRLLDALEENDDVQSVTANYNLPDDVMAAVAADE